MRTGTRHLWLRAVAVGVILIAAASSTYAQTTESVVPSVTLSNGTTLTDVSVVRVDFNMVLLSYSGGGNWFPIDELSDESRAALGLRTRDQERLFEESLSGELAEWRDINGNADFSAWLMDRRNEERMDRIRLLRDYLRRGDFRRVAEMMHAWRDEQKLVTQERADRAAREEHWRSEGLNRLTGLRHDVTFLGSDGNTVSRDSSLLTDGEKELYLRQYVEDHEAIRRERQERWRDDLKQNLETGRGYRITFTTPDGRLIDTDSRRLTGLEKRLYMAKYLDEQENNFSREQADSKAAHDAQWQQEARRNLEGSNREVSFRDRDGMYVQKNWAELSNEDRALFLNQYTSLRHEQEDTRAAREALLTETARKEFQRKVENHEISPNQKDAYLRQSVESNQRASLSEIRQKHDQVAQNATQRSPVEVKDMNDPRNQPKVFERPQRDQQQQNQQQQQQQQPRQQQTRQPPAPPQTNSTNATTSNSQFRR